MSAKYLTKGGEMTRNSTLTVNVDTSSRTQVKAACQGCGDTMGHFMEHLVTNWAKKHAESCRAV